MSSYKEEVTSTHDAFCITAALQSVLENRSENGDFTFTLEEALEEAYGYLAEGVSSCRCLFAGLKGEAKVLYLLQFSDSALVAMAQGGYRNDSTGELMKVSLEELQEVENYRKERGENWEAEYLANDLVGDQNSYSAIVASDTVGSPSYSLLVNGKKSTHGTFVNKWGIAYATVRELQAAGIDPELNTGLIGAVLETLHTGDSISANGTVEFSTVLESDN